MKATFGKKLSFMSLLMALALLAPGWASAETKFGRIVVFGDSLSDPGNDYALRGGENIPPYNDPDKLDALLIPDVSYARGGHHFSNGATWVEQLARPLGLAGNTRPAFQGSSTEATNYAVKGARAHDETIPIHVNLSAQVSTFLSAFGGAAPSDALYVVEFGGNDIHDALDAFASGGDGSPIIADALTTIGNNIGALYAAGGRKFLIWNAPNLGLTPAVRTLDPFTPPPGAVILAGLITDSFNSNLDALLGYLPFVLPGIEIVKFDVHKKIQDLVDSPVAFGLTVVDTACIMPNIPPFECQTPDEYLFWDGFHPTKAVHAIFAQEAAFALTH
jgi:phospholipase/lecithinase/hemolysin